MKNLNTIGARERDRQWVAALVGQYTAAGNSATTLQSYTPKPLPPRRSKIDPETVPKRKQATKIRKAGGRA